MSIAELVIKQDIIRKLEENFEKYTAIQKMPEPSRVSMEAAQLFELKTKVDRLTWLTEGPDTYDTITQTVGSAELRIDWTPFLIWGGSIFNANNPGATLLLRFTNTYGRYKQYKLAPNASVNLDLKGGLGSILNYVSDGTGNVDVRGLILLKAPQYL